MYIECDTVYTFSLVHAKEAAVEGHAPWRAKLQNELPEGRGCLGTRLLQLSFKMSLNWAGLQ